MSQYTFRVPLSLPTFDGNEIRYLQECIADRRVSSLGRFLDAFEALFASTVDAPHAIACQSGTAAIHLGLIALGVERGDEVWVSDLTFIASANPAAHLGARIVLVDSEPATGNLDVDVVIGELERRARMREAMPKAIVPVHLVGQVAAVDALVDVARLHGVGVVEDATESLGATWTSGWAAGRSVGTLGEIGCFSFNGNKLLSTGGGGMIVTADAALGARMRHLSTQAKLPGLAYLHDEAGFNYRLTNVAAAIGLAQLERIDATCAAKRSIAARYRAGFAGSRVEGPFDPEGVAPVHWLSTVRVASKEIRDDALRALHEAGFEARALWPPLRHQTPYRDSVVLGGEVAVDLSTRSINLPSSVDLAPEDQDAIITALLSVAG
jgi:dTDP-4-amino-4,6-dideoxygalactose transaminase